MKYLKYGFIQFSRNFSLCLIMIAEITAIIVALNISIGSYNSRNMLYKPFEQYLNQDGWYIKASEFDSSEDKLSEIIGELEGEFEEISFYNSTVSTLNGEVKIAIVNDSLYEKLCMPLEFGDYSEAVITSNPYFNLNDSLQLGTTIINLSGVLTENTYIPNLSGYHIDMDVTHFYDVYQSGAHSIQQDAFGTEVKQTPIVIVPQSKVQTEIDRSLNNGVYQSFWRLLVSTSELSDEQRRHNDEILKQNSMSVPYMSFSVLNDRSLIYVNESLEKVIPIIACVGIIALFGVLCCCSINVSRNLRNNAILYICGASHKDCSKINAVTDFIVVFVSLLISLGILRIVSTTSLNESIGFIVDRNNVIATVVFAIAVFLVTRIVSAFVFARKTPKDILNSGGI